MARKIVDTRTEKEQRIVRNISQKAEAFTLDFCKSHLAEKIGF